MNPFERLGKRAVREWGRAGRRLGAFPGIATRLLTDFSYDFNLAQLDECLAKEFLRGKLPEQVSLYNTFGQPPVTLFNNGMVVVDLYFWLTCDTAIHSHGFRGAFRVLHGKSLHETFDVRVTNRIAPGVLQCRPGTPAVALLDPGDVQAILPGERLTHRVIHLENPTVTLCVKTINEPGLYQWEYFPDGLAVQRRNLDPGLIKGLYYYQYLVGRDPSQADLFLERLLGAESIVARMVLYNELSSGAFDLADDTVEQCLAQIRGFHGTAAWFRQYESAVPLHLKDLYVECCTSPMTRLAAHFINGGYGLKTIASPLARLAGRALSWDEVRILVGSLMDFEPIFGCELSPEDRALIRHLVERPARKIPKHLQPFGQIPRMREFIAKFA